MAIFDFFKTIWRKEEKIADKKTEFDPEHFKFKTKIELRFNDFDLMGHVNNAVYFSYMETGRSKYWEHAINWNWNKTGVIIAKASIDYIQPVHLNDKLSMYIRTSRIGNTSFDLEYLLIKNSGSGDIVCSKGKTTCIAYDYQHKRPVPIPDIERRKMMEFEQL